MNVIKKAKIKIIKLNLKSIFNKSNISMLTVCEINLAENLCKSIEHVYA